MKKIKSNLNWWRPTFGKTYLSAFEPLLKEAQTREDVSWIVRILKLPKSASILDIPCGAGRHCFEFAKLHYNVIGIDFSDVLLSEAKKRARIKKMNLKFLKGDMRNLRIHQHFDAIVNLGNSFGYFTDLDNEKVIKNFSRLLNPSGLLILDLPNTAGMMRRLEAKSKMKTKGGYILSEETLFDPLKMVINLRWTVFQNNKKIILNGMLRLYTFPEIKKILEVNNLRVKKVFGSFSDESYSIDTPRMIILAQKIR